MAVGRRLLEQNAHIRTTIASVPKDQSAALGGNGWIFWNETLALTPTDSVGANTFASNTLRRLSGKKYSIYLTLDGGVNAARILPSLLRQLDTKHFVVNIPMETRL